ncbi:hypothetical protein ACVGXP_00610, partial [Enterobacter hormaechei]
MAGGAALTRPKISLVFQLGFGEKNLRLPEAKQRREHPEVKIHQTHTRKKQLKKSRREREQPQFLIKKYEPTT